MWPKEIVALFDSYLAERNLRLEATVIGGAALGLMGVVSRQTQDYDILHPTLSEEIKQASLDFALQCRQKNVPLIDSWLNNGPASLADQLPEGWQDQRQEIFRGKAISLYGLGRLDLLRSKIFALCDRGLDLEDCVALAPTREELAAIAPWLEIQDANPRWPDHVRETIEDLLNKVSHGV